MYCSLSSLMRPGHQLVRCEQRAPGEWEGVCFPGPVAACKAAWLQRALCLLRVQKTILWGLSSAALVVQSALCTPEPSLVPLNV